ncbi:related to AOS1 - Smt3p activating protein [Melanopsichium pennsylvanicum]|uniref:Related to AOS1 - Smt3p activating protein n=1 Tax=Melanopsichium pennsylvanicum TaxID=63383 RepID=A0AAJ4XH63_9BASI|nr:related to AOS1 - Smt3p activating protein [Melanopsichium pennsylvanicum]
MDQSIASAATSNSTIDPITKPPQSVINDNSNAVTEDEAALYDRQIRLWGLEAQNRLRTSHILIVGWNGVATEIIKNTVLSGIGSITILDPSVIDGEIDLVSGFFFRHGEVGQLKCSQAPLDRVRSLNPLVKVEGVFNLELYETLLIGDDRAIAWLKEKKVDVLVAGTPFALSSSNRIITTSCQDVVQRLNQTTRGAGVKFFLSATYGFGGFYFSDQVIHDYLIERTLPSTTNQGEIETRRVKQRQIFIPISECLAYTWKNLTQRQQKRIGIPVDWFIWLAFTDLITNSSSLNQDGENSFRNQNDLFINSHLTSNALKDRTFELIREKGLEPKMIFGTQVDEKEIENIFQTRLGQGGFGITLAPVASVLGGMLSQDILNAISGREEPVVNWLFLHADASGSASVHRIGNIQSAIVVD